MSWRITGQILDPATGETVNGVITALLDRTPARTSTGGVVDRPATPIPVVEGDIIDTPLNSVPGAVWTFVMPLGSRSVRMVDPGDGASIDIGGDLPVGTPVPESEAVLLRREWATLREQTIDAVDTITSSVDAATQAAGTIADVVELKPKIDQSIADAASAKTDAAAALSKATQAVTSQDSATAQNVTTGTQTQAALRAVDFLVKRDADAVIKSLALTSSLGNTVMMRLAKGLNGARWSMESSTKATGTAGMELQLVPDDNLNPNASGTEILLFHKTGADYQRSTWHTQAQQVWVGCSSGGTAPIMPWIFYMGEYAPQKVAGINAMILGGDGSVTINGGRAVVNTNLIPAGATVTSVASDGKSATISAGPTASGEWSAGVGYITQVLVGSTTLTGITITADSTTITSPNAVFTSGMVGQTIVDQRVYANQYARIGDVMDSGQSRLILDTCTKTPGNATTTDKTSIQYNRGGSTKWRTGNNMGGANADSYDVTNAQGVNYMRVGQNGNIGLGLNANQNGLIPSGVGVFGISNATTAPTSNPTGGGNLYASGGALYWRGSNGTVTKIADA